MTEAKHTPLPWVIEETQRVINSHNHTLFQIASAYGADDEWSGTGVAVCILPDEDKTIKTLAMVKANAELICRAVNNHDALVEALEEAERFLPSIPSNGPQSAKILELLAKAKAES